MCIFNHNKPEWEEVVCSNLVLSVEPHSDAISSLCLLLGGDSWHKAAWVPPHTRLDCDHSKIWITARNGPRVGVLNILEVLTGRKHWIHLEIWTKTDPDPEEVEIRFVDARQHCALAMLNFLLDFFCSLDSSCRSRTCSSAFDTHLRVCPLCTAP